jgi:hypothetical protein
MDEGAHGGRVRPPAHRDQVDVADELGLDQRPGDEARHRHRELGDHGEAQARQRHALDPVVALGDIGAADGHPLALADLADVVPVFAVDAAEIAVALEVGEPHLAQPRQRVTRRHSDQEPLGIKAERVQGVGRLARLAVDGDVDLAPREQLLELAGGAVAQVELDPLVLLVEGAEQVDQLRRADGAHEAHRQPRLTQLDEALGPALGLLHSAMGLVEIGPHHAAELGQVGVAALAVHQRPAQLVLEAANRPGQRRLDHVALLGRAREIQRAREGEKIANLVQLHRIDSRPSGAAPNISPTTGNAYDVWCFGSQRVDRDRRPAHAGRLSQP